MGGSDYNVFEGICSNCMFMFITILTFVVQCVLCEYGGAAVRCTPLSHYHNLVCFAIGGGGIIWGFITKLILPPSLFKCMSMDEKPMTELERQDSIVGSFKKSRLSRTKEDDKVKVGIN